MRRLSDEQRIEEWFMRAEPDAAKVMLDKVNLIMRTRGVAPDPPRRGRPRGQKQPKTLEEGTK